MPEQLEELIVRNLVEALNRLTWIVSNCGRQPCNAFGIPLQIMGRPTDTFCRREIQRRDDPFFSCRNGQSPRPERELFAARQNH